MGNGGGRTFSKCYIMKNYKRTQRNCRKYCLEPDMLDKKKVTSRTLIQNVKIRGLSFQSYQQF